MIKPFGRRFGSSAVIAVAIIAATTGRADAQQNAYVITRLGSDIAALGGKVIDPVLQNAWGVAFSPAGSPFWIGDNATGCSTLYNGDGTKVGLQVSIPLPGGSVPPTACKTVNPNSPPNPTPAAPTGIIWNPSSAFVVPGSVSPANRSEERRVGKEC